MLIRELMRDVRTYMMGRRINRAAIPEGYPLLRTLQFAAQYWSTDIDGVRDN
jgi:hypothetical protein